MDISLTLQAYLEEGFRLFSREGILEEVATEVYELRCLLNSIYQFFLLEQKERINTFILSFAIPDWEKTRYRGGSRIGYSRHLILSTIPKDELKNFPDLKKQFYELERKFGKHQEKRPEQVGFEAIEQPLPEDAYENMTREQWIASFKVRGKNKSSHNLFPIRPK